MTDISQIPDGAPEPKVPPHPITIPGIGDGYVRPLTVGRYTKLAQLGYEKGHDRSLGLALIAACISRSKEYREPLLTGPQANSLPEAEQERLAHDVAAVNGWTLEDDDPITSLATTFTAYAEKITRPIVESFKKLEKELAEPLAKLKDVLSIPTLKNLVEQTALSKRMVDALKAPDWLERYRKAAARRRSSFRVVRHIRAGRP